MSVLLVILLQAAPIMADLSTYHLAPSSKPIDLAAERGCRRAASSEEIVVCSDKSDRYRLPLPTDRRSPARVRGEGQTGVAALAPSAPCGIFAGERRCRKEEAAQYGYGNGRDPITALARVVQKVADPDADQPE